MKHDLREIKHTGWDDIKDAIDRGDMPSFEESNYPSFHHFGNIRYRDLEEMALFNEEDDMITNEKLSVKKIDNHYHIKIGCQETIAHDKKEAMKWLGKMWDEFVAKEE